MTKTINVRGDYEVAADQTLNFENRLAFHLLDDKAQLDNQGQIDITFSNAASDTFGVMSDERGTIVNAAGAVFSMTDSSDRTGYDAVGAYGDVASFENDGDWRVVSTHSSAVGMQFTSDLEFSNTGSIEALGVTGATGISAGFGGDYSNTGQILAQASGGDAKGMILHSVGSTFSFDNTGTIEADGVAGSVDTYAVGFAGHEGPTWELTNSGVIRSNGYAFIQLQDENPPQHTIEILHNSGKMIGQIDMGIGADQLINTGAIVGNVEMGKDNDIFDGSGGRLTGELFGGGGADTLIAGKGDDIIHGDNAGLAASTDAADLIEGGKGADQLFGDGGDDTLVAGAGPDTMTGGAGDDTFAFTSIKALSGPSDVITDLEQTDVIDLSAIDADTTKAGNQAFHLVSSFTGHAGEAVLFYQGTDPGQTILELDVNGDGAADGEVVLDGNHTSFTNFVL